MRELWLMQSEKHIKPLIEKFRGHQVLSDLADRILEDMDSIASWGTEAKHLTALIAVYVGEPLFSGLCAHLN